ncbi:phosphatase PAP2 family protein [Psychroserpens sp. Hel_I_66]|uniref:phosphatase PAP2 family protein n=1 Tax=Psychroserpens sp. Hel_I_66 TaxID=1250004 RepID=UPI00068A7192|nr:phosphatase PAP2 family protein [Psychroserpens sp. Hel_I_66]
MQRILVIILILLSLNINAQQSTSPYEWDWTRDGIWTGAALAGSAGGFLIIQNKEPFTELELENFRNNIDDINGIDRWAAGNFSEDASKISDIPFAISFAAPFALLLDGKANDHAGQLFGIYIESLATTSTLFTISAGLTNRARPYAYSEEAPLNRRLSTSATRSFYSGHVAATSTATFFAAKVFQDFNPDSRAIPYVWAGAALLPAAVGYYRIEAGQHFLTDVLLGYTLGGIGWLLYPRIA